MDRQHVPYTVGIWKVNAGREEEFIAAWEAFARWTAREVPGAREGHLLRDRSTAGMFLSFGAWESAEAIAAWRSRPEFATFAAQAKELCSVFEPHSMERVAGTE